MSLRYGSFSAEHGELITIPALFMTKPVKIEEIEKIIYLGNSITWSGKKKHLNPIVDFTLLIPFQFSQKQKIILEFNRVNSTIEVLQSVYTNFYNQEKIYTEAYEESVRMRKERLDIIELSPLQEKIFKVMILSMVNRTIVKMDLISKDSQFENLDKILEDFDFEESYQEYRDNPNAYAKYHHDYLVLKNIIRKTLYLPNELRRNFTNVANLHAQLSKYLQRIQP